MAKPSEAMQCRVVGRIAKAPEATMASGGVRVCRLVVVKDADGPASSPVRVGLYTKGSLLDWHRDYATGADAVMIARRNRDVDHLNEAARELRREEGALGSAEVIVGEAPSPQATACRRGSTPSTSPTASAGTFSPWTRRRAPSSFAASAATSGLSP